MGQAMKAYLLGLVVILLTACTNTSSAPALTQTPPLIRTATATLLHKPAQPTATSISPTPSPTLTPTISPSVAEGLRMAYVIEGNLYLQDGFNPPVQLTDDERRDRYPFFSDDGEKIVFLRGLLPYDLYSINPDGSQEQLLVSGSKLNELGLGYSEMSEIQYFQFISGTHQLVFNTIELDEADLRMQDTNRLSSKFNADLLLVDADTAEIKMLLDPGQGGSFDIAPNGNMIAVQGDGYVDLVDLNGQIIRRNLITYIPTRPYKLGADVFWNDDSTELLITLPIGTEYYFDGPELRTAWRIAIDGTYKTQISFDPPLLASLYSFSPDGKWILYSYFYYPAKTDDSIVSGLYLGNLLESSSQLIAENAAEGLWSPDSNHFLYEAQGWHLMNPDGQSNLIDYRESILDWVDDDHFLGHADGLITIGGLDGSIIEIPIPASVHRWRNQFAFVFTKSNP